MSNNIDAIAIMQLGMDAMKERASSRDVDNERSMACCVASFNALYGTNLSEEMGWMFQVILKAARSKGGDVRLDDYVDGSAYFGLAGEAAMKERS